MTAAERRFRLRVARLVRDLQPEIAAAVVAAFAALRTRWTEAAILRALDTGDMGALLTDEALATAVAPVRVVLADAVRRAAVASARDIPRARDLGVVFDVLNPRVIEAVRALDTQFVQQLTADVRQTVQQVAERALVQGQNPRVVARELRAAIGLGPTQEVQVQNFRRALETGDSAKAFTYLKRDRRFDATIRKGDLSREQIDKYVDIYRKRRIALNAESVSRTAAITAQKQGQRLSWERAIDLGVAERGQLRRRWATTIDGRQRDEHDALNGEVVGFDELFSNGELTPGDQSFNCRCLAVVFLAARSEN